MQTYFQRLEAAVVFFALLIAYIEISGNFWLVAGFLFAPDVFMLGYLRNNTFGAALYNLAHMYGIPAVLVAVGYYIPSQLVTELGLIWALHIAVDRGFGYGLKSTKGFKHTHLGDLK